MGSTDGYIRCAALGCYAAKAEILADIPLCTYHAERLRQELEPLAFSNALTTSNAVVYYVAWRHRPDVLKIGTTTNLRYRLRQLSTLQSPAKVIVAEPGSYYLERKTPPAIRSPASRSRR